MPALSFTNPYKATLVEQGRCFQTIRPPRKRAWKVKTDEVRGDKLHLYWNQRQKDCRLLGVGEVVSVVRKQFQYITEDEFIADGFVSHEQAWHWFFTTYEKKIRQLAKLFKRQPVSILGELEFDIIQWIPWREGEA